jgi:hypothetical protein
VLEVISDITGLHAQLQASAELMLWARAEGVTQDTLEQALWKDRSVVKTWAMRGTLHVFPTQEFPIWQSALSTYRHYQKPSWLRSFGVTAEELETVLAAVAKALAVRMMTRTELAAEVTRLTGSRELGDKLRESWGAMLKPAAFRGGLCFAPNVGQNVCFTTPDQWIPRGEPIESNRALLEVARRFLSAHGPATREDFARWWGMGPAHASALLRRMGDEITEVEVGMTPMWVLTKHLPALKDATTPRCVRLLPAFDQYIIAASRHALNLMPGNFKDRVYRPQGWISPVLLVDGRMEGIWQHQRRGDRLFVELEPFVEMPMWVQRAAQREAERLAAYMGATLELTWRPVD